MIAGLSLVIPAYDEEARLPATLAAAAAALPGLARESEIVVVDDGSTDRTAEVARRAAGAVPVRVVRLERNRGKGAAVARGIAASRFPLVAFTDADCPYELDSLRPALEALAAGRADLAIGARDLPGSQVSRGYGPLRRVSGKILSLLTWLAIGLPFRDSQCGLKAFRRETAEELFALRTVDGFGFDFEILAAAVRLGRRVMRFPVLLTHDDDSRISLLRDSLRVARDLLRVRRNLRRGAYDRSADGVEPVPCPLCGATEFEPRAARDGFRMVECAGCRLWYLNPMPTRATLEALYAGQYYASPAAQRGGYADYAAMADDLRATFGHRLRLVAARPGQRRLLDVGGGFGYLADAAAADFAERWVVEWSADAAGRIAPRHRVVVGAFADVELPEGYFDLVSMQDCLEHLPDPREALAKARRVLRPGGRLLVVTPNVDSWLARVQRGRWVSLKLPEHVILYRPATLDRLLEESGFRVERRVAAGQYARLDFVAARLAGGRVRLADGLERWVRRLGGGAVRLWVPSGSSVVVATLAESAARRPEEPLAESA